MNDALRRQGYLAIEAGRTIDTRPRQPSRAFTPATPVVVAKNQLNGQKTR